MQFCCQFLNRQRKSFWLPISESAATQFCCWFMNRQQKSFWLPISESTAKKFWAADLWISSGIVGCRFLNWQRRSFVVDFWIDSGKIFGCWFLNRQRYSLAADFWIDSGKVVDCRFLNWQRHNWLPICESAATM